jgi:hypothetical protein
VGVIVNFSARGVYGADNGVERHLKGVLSGMYY